MLIFSPSCLPCCSIFAEKQALLFQTCGYESISFAWVIKQPLTWHFVYTNMIYQGLIDSIPLQLGTLSDSIRFRERDKEAQRGGEGDFSCQVWKVIRTILPFTSPCMDKGGTSTPPSPLLPLPGFILISEQIFKLIPGLFLCPLVNKFVPVSRKEKEIYPRRTEHIHSDVLTQRLGLHTGSEFLRHYFRADSVCYCSQPPWDFITDSSHCTTCCCIGDDFSWAEDLSGLGTYSLENGVLDRFLKN